MKLSLVRLLACPACRSELEVLAVDGRPPDAAGEPAGGEPAGGEPAGGEPADGELRCTSCKRSYPIRGGIPSFASDEERAGHVATSFGFEWQTHHDGGFEADTVFGRTIDEDVAQFDDVFALPPATPGAPDPLAGMLVVDAGCGSGALTAEIARRHPEATVVGLDINPAIGEVYKASLELPNLHVVHASVFDLPFADGAERGVDRLWCNGVIHHTGDTRGAFVELARVVRRGGLLFVWVYQRKLSPLVLVRDLLRPFGLHRWSHPVLYRVCRALSVPTFAAVQVLRQVGRIPLVGRSTHGRILTRDRHLDELALTWFDVLSPRFRDTNTKAELESWFTRAGYTDLRHYWWPVGVTGRRG